MGSRDTSSKYLIDHDPEGIVRWLLKDNSATVLRSLNTEFEFVSRRSDSLWLLHGEEVGQFCVLIELQLKYDAEMPARLQNYAAMARQKYKLPILPVVIYLSPPPKTVTLASSFHLEFMGLVTHQDFLVVKIWELDARSTNQIPDGLLPFIALMKNTSEQIVLDAAFRLQKYSNADELQTILALFAKMTMSTEFVNNLLSRLNIVIVLTETPFFKEFLREAHETGHAEGHAEGRKDTLVRNILRVVSHRLGQPSNNMDRRLEALLPDKLELVLDAAVFSADFNQFEQQLQEIESTQ